MDPIIVSVNDRLANVGDTVSLVGHLDMERFDLSERSFALPQGMDYDVVLSNVGEGILATGILRAKAVGTCDRCLDEAVLDVAAEVDEYYLFSEPDVGVLEEDEEEGPDYTLVSPDATIDLSDALSTAFVMDIPYVVLCQEDCAGLCPVCGENLNKVDCGHAEQLEQEAEQDRLASSPFAALRDLKLD
ncbi:MAG: DUF177 domain-containing protein [Coriobacteriales bacterium]|nr:DUF177 domain-containing protein [Coriobacteriales bacterium]